MTQSPAFLSGQLGTLPLPDRHDVQVILVPERCGLPLPDQTLICSSGNILVTKGKFSYISEGLPSLPTLLLKEAFFDSLFYAQIMDCPLFYDLLRTESDSARLLHFDCFPTDVSWVIAQILFFEAAKVPESIKTVHAACTLLFTNLHQIHRERLLIGHSTMMVENKIGEVLTYMSNHYRDITLESAAAAFHYHPAYFSAWFKKNARMTFRQQLLKLRLEQSKFLLRETSLPVQTIIEEIGFQEKSHFHRCFKQEFGMTPLAYRRLTNTRRAKAASDTDPVQSPAPFPPRPEFFKR